MQEFIIPRAKLVEIPISSAAGFLKMPDNLSDLNNANICGVQVATATEQSTAPSGNVTMAVADLPKIGLVLKKMPGSEAMIDNVPVYLTDRELNAGHYFLFKKFRWNSSASGVQINATGLTVGQSILFTIFYIPLDSRGNEIL